MQKLDSFNNSDYADLVRLVESKTTKTKNGHEIYHMPESRKNRNTPDQSFRRKYYPVWLLLELMGRIPEERTEDYGTDIQMASNCGEKFCVSPKHLKWVRRGGHRAKFYKNIFDSPVSVWDEKSKQQLIDHLEKGRTPAQISKLMSLALANIHRACKALAK